MGRNNQCETCEHRGACRLRLQCKEIDKNGCMSYKNDPYVKEIAVYDDIQERMDEMEENMKTLNATFKTIFIGFLILFVTLVIIMLWSSNAFAFSRESKSTDQWTELGTYKITHYCSCTKCCGKNSGTASGEPLTRYKTIAMNGVPFGTLVYIDTYGYRIVQDRGPLGDHHIDVYTEDHQHALKLGVQYHKVWIVKEGT